MFPPFRLDAADQCLWRGSVRLSLAPKAFAVLNYLVERAGRLVSQEDLLAAVWPETFVQPEILRKYILEIRRVLEDPPKNPLFIETLPRRGYRFIAAVEGEDADRDGDAAADGTGSLVGRDAALAELDAYLSRAVRGQRTVVFVTGEAGIGKTSLVDHFQESHRRESELQTARGQCVEGFGGKEAYYPVLEALGLLLRGVRGGPVVDTLTAHAPTWLIQFPYLVRPERRGALLQEILGANRERMVREFCEVVEALTAERPMLLILEDLQWADDSTLDLISALARRRGSARLLLLATYRPVEIQRSPLKILKQELLIHRLCQEISLERLTDGEMERYLAAEFPRNCFAPGFAALIQRHSDGNPLFMVALLQRLTQQGVLAERGGEWTLTASPEQLDPGVPETLQQMLEVQLDQLSANDRRLLRAASVAGRRFSAWAAGVMLEGDPGQVEETCETLAAGLQFIRRGGIQELADGSVSAEYEFQHALYREVLYRQLPPLQCRQFHLRLAERMEELVRTSDCPLAAELASHFEACGDYRRAVRYLILTAGISARRFAHSDSVQLLRHGLELVGHLPRENAAGLEIEVLERMSDVLYAQGEMDESAEIDERVAELAERGGFKAAHVNALTRQARALAFVDPERCVAVCDRAVEVSRTHDDALLQARAEMLMACWHMVADGGNQQDWEACAAARARIERLSRDLPAYHEILYAHVQCIRGEFEGAAETARAGIPKSVANDSLAVYFSAHSSLAQALLHLGRWGELLQVLQRAHDAAQKNGNAPWLGLVKANLAWLRYHACDYAGARQVAEELLVNYREEPAGQVQTMALTTSAYCHLVAGDAGQSLELFRRVCERRRHPRFFFDWYWQMIGRFGLARAWLAKEELNKASEEADLLLEAARAGCDPVAQAFACELQARVALARQEPAAALDFCERAFATLADRPIPFVSWRLHALGWEIRESGAESAAAARHRLLAAQLLHRLAESFPENEPLRASFLAAPVVKRIIEAGVGSR